MISIICHVYTLLRASTGGVKSDVETKPQASKTSPPKGFILLIVLFVVMAVSNPTKPEYVSWVKEQTMGQKSNSTLGSELVSLFAGPIIDSVTTSNNYLFFTIFTTKNSGKYNGSVLGLFHNFIPL